jgi:hypothetical protein
LGAALPAFRLDVKSNFIGGKMEQADLEGETQHGFPKDLYKKAGGPGLAEEGLPVIDAGVNLMPDTLGKLT